MKVLADRVRFRSIDRVGRHAAAILKEEKSISERRTSKLENQKIPQDFHLENLLQTSVTVVSLEVQEMNRFV